MHINPELTALDFCVYPILAVLVWAVAHRLVYRFAITPLVKHYNLSDTVDKIKFEMSAWKFFTFSASTVFGFVVLSRMPWTFTPELYLRYWPDHPFTWLEQAYYIFSFGNVAYSSLVMLIEPKQKDFPAMIIHHVTTLGLIIFSYTVQLQRIGCIVLIIHDVSDPIMEAAKCSLYMGKKVLANVLFVVFTIVFFVTRLFMYPYYVIMSFLLFAIHENGLRYPSGDYKLFHSIMVSLYILQALHIYWAYLLAAKVLTEKELKGDIRDKDD